MILPVLKHFPGFPKENSSEGMENSSRKTKKKTIGRV